jgi:hypothetical protein
MRYVVVVVFCCCCFSCSLWVDLTASVHVYILFTSNLKSFVLSLCGNCPFQTILHTRCTRPFIITLRANDPQAQWFINNNRKIGSQMEISHYHNFFFSQSTITPLPIFYYFQIPNIAYHFRILHESYPCYRRICMYVLSISGSHGLTSFP